MKKQQGFTLIELVVVIIILGILAVVAAPKFINLQGDARASTLKGMEAAIQGANSLLYSKASLKGIEKLPMKPTVADNGTATTPEVEGVALNYGYAAATVAAITAAVDADTAANGDWIVQVPAKATNPASVILAQKGAPGITDSKIDANSTCILTYTQAAKAGELPTYKIDASGC